MMPNPQARPGTTDESGCTPGSVQAPVAGRPRVGTGPLTCNRGPRWLSLVLAWLRAPADNLRTATRGAKPGGTRSEGMPSQLPGLSTPVAGQGRLGTQPARALGVGLDARPAAARTMGRWEGLPGGDLLFDQDPDSRDSTVTAALTACRNPHRHPRERH
jgi:hypothetical protein